MKKKTLKCNLKIYILMLTSFSTLSPKYTSFKIYRLKKKKRNNLDVSCNVLPSIPLNHVHMATQIKNKFSSLVFKWDLLCCYVPFNRKWAEMMFIHYLSKNKLHIFTSLSPSWEWWPMPALKSDHVHGYMILWT